MTVLMFMLVAMVSFIGGGVVIEALRRRDIECLRSDLALSRVREERLEDKIRELKAALEELREESLLNDYGLRERREGEQWSRLR